MYRDAVEYKPGHWLAPGSKALELYKEKKWAELEALLKETDAAWRKLQGSSNYDQTDQLIVHTTTQAPTSHIREREQKNQANAIEQRKKIALTCLAHPYAATLVKFRFSL